MQAGSLLIPARIQYELRAADEFFANTGAGGIGVGGVGGIRFHYLPSPR